jgi:hypothetical protein
VPYLPLLKAFLAERLAKDGRDDLSPDSRAGFPHCFFNVYT